MLLKTAIECNGWRRTKTSRQKISTCANRDRYISKVNSTDIEDCSVSELQCSGENNRFRD